MTVKIGIIGLGQIGASIGLALARRKDQVTTIGYDKSAEVTRKAHKLEVVENFAHNLYDCIKEADLVILALPIDQVYETLARLRTTGTSLLIVEQQVSNALELCDRAVLLGHGRVDWSGPTSEASAVIHSEFEPG